MATSFTTDRPGLPITEYEEHRNITKKALHDAVETNLLAAGFTFAAALRPLFSGEGTCVGRDVGSSDCQKRKRRVHTPKPDSIAVRRGRRNKPAVVDDRSASNVLLQNSSKAEVAESFSTWPGKQAPKQMKSKKLASKRKASKSPEPDLPSDLMDSVPQSPRNSNFEEKGPTAALTIETSFPEVHVQGRQGDRHIEEHVSGHARPQEGGYRALPPGRRAPTEWEEDYRFQYGQPSADRFGRPFRRPYSPRRYEGGRDFDGREDMYGGRGRQFDRHHDFIDRRDLYYDVRTREFDLRDRDPAEEVRYDERRYDRRTPIPSDMYERGMLESPAAPPYARSLRGGTSPPPSSSANLTESVKEEGAARRPLHLDKLGRPTGKMATLFHADIVSFVKDMNPVEGWERQTQTAKERLLERLIHDYEFYGDSTRLSDKFLKKEAGAALIQYRYTLNQMIDKGSDMPEGFNEDYWKTLVARRKSDEAKEKSAKMANIARGRSSKNTTKKSLEQSVMLELSKGLKREPYDAEIKEAVEKQWAAIQEEVTEKRRLKAATNATAAVAKATRDLDVRLQGVESMMQNWSAQLELWKGILSDASGKQLPIIVPPTVGTGPDLAMTVAIDDVGPGSEVPLPKDTESSEDEDKSEKSKSSSEEESGSENEQSMSDSDEHREETVQLAGVVEPEAPKTSPLKPPKVPVSSSKPRKTTACDALKASPHSNVGPTSSAMEVQVSVPVGLPLKRGIPDASNSVGKGKQDSAIPPSEVPEKQSRPTKKLKGVPNSVEEPLVLDEGALPSSEAKATSLGKSTKPPRRNSKSTATKIETKGGKELAIAAGDMMLMENTEPKKFLGVASRVCSDYDRDSVLMPGHSNRKLVRLRLKRVIFPSAPLAYVEVDDTGQVVCKTLGEAFEKQLDIWWPAPPELQ